MKLVDADVIWVPINKYNMDAPKPRLSADRKTPLGLAANQGRQMDAGQKSWGNGRNQYVQEPSGETQNNPTSVMAGGIGNEISARRALRRRSLRYQLYPRR